MTKPDRGVALVTGASAGIGRATAEAFGTRASASSEPAANPSRKALTA